DREPEASVYRCTPTLLQQGNDSARRTAIPAASLISRTHVRLSAGTYALFLVRSEGLEPPRFYSLPPQGSASTNSATSAWDTGWRQRPRRIDGADVTNQGWRDKAVLRLN